MRQVPYFLIIGNGRLARHFSAYFKQLGLEVMHWYRQSRQALQELLPLADYIWLMISDDALEPFIKQHFVQTTRQPRWIHCSGARYFDTVLGVHPLFAFANSLFDRAVYSSIPLVLDHAREEYGDLWTVVKNPTWIIKPNDKILYHALCALMGNFPTHIWQNILSIWSTLGLESALFKPYLHSLIDNLMTSPHQALTGPVARGDQNVVKQHLNALQPYAALEDYYQCFIKNYACSSSSFPHEGQGICNGENP